MRAVVFHGHENMRVETVSDPGIQQPTDVLVRVEKTAICGSDLHLWHMEQEPEDAGFVVGHEFLGTIEDVGSGVQRFAKGDRVLVACTTGCGQCASCSDGLFSGCPVTTAGFTQQNVFGFSNGLWGGQAEAVRVPFADANCFAVPQGLGDEQVLFLTDILPTGAMGADLAKVGAGDVVVVFGCGPVGVFAQRAAQLRGAARVIAVDLNASRLQRAQERGCIAVNPQEVDVQEVVLEHTSGRGADAAIEAVGSAELIHQAAAALRPGGRLAVIGVLLAPYEIEWPMFFSKNLSLSTGLVSPQVYIPTLLDAIREERLDPAEIISHRFALEEAPAAYELFASRRDDVLKVVLTP